MELAIVMVVVGILMGGALIPMRALEERRQLREEMRRMEIVRDAIVGYALRHRTRERIIRYVNWYAPDHAPWEFRLPAGRPYLPCPDFDGDGFEDRVPDGPGGFMQGMEVKPNLNVTAHIADFPGARAGETSLHWVVGGFINNSGTRLSAYSSNVQYGDCLVSRGTVPWRTLGVEPSDGWGNRHTYYADPVFSSAIFGFDRQTIADLYDPRVPEAPGFHPSPRRPWDWVFPDRKPGCPAAICDGGRSDDEAVASQCLTQNYFLSFLPSIRQCGWGESRGITRDGNPLLDKLVLKAGAVTKEDIGGRKYFPPGSVIDGLPFVLVSHGPNGRFAVNHWATLNNPTNLSGLKRPICNNDAWSDFESTDRFEHHRSVSLKERGLAHEAANGARFADGTECSMLQTHFFNVGDSAVDFNFSFFVWEPPGAGNKSGFDDLLLWMTREELSVATPGRILRLPRMMVPYFSSGLRSIPMPGP